MHNRINIRKHKTPMSRPTFVDLFCGAGLFSEGLRATGFHPLLALDVDRKAIGSYRQNISDVAQVGDVRQIETGLRADVLIAGPPCQGFSTLGRMDPRDQRNRLALEVPKWAQSLNASVVVIENVPRFLASPTHKRLTSALRRQGYEVESHILNAQDFGAAQLRERAFTIGSLVGTIGAPSARCRRPKTFREVAIDLPFRTGDPMHIWPVPGALALERFRTIPRRGDKRDLMNRRPDLCPDSWGRIYNEATDVWGRIDADLPTNTLRCNFQNPSKGRYIHPFKNRVISLREGARLQGIPERWIMVGERYPIARQIGNGVPIPMARAIARRISQALDGHGLIQLQAA